MLRLWGKKKAQGTAEYAILIGVIVAVAIGMQTYVKRGIQGRVKDEADEFTAQIAGDTAWSGISNTTVTLARQFEPLGLSSQATQETKHDDSNSNMTKGGSVGRGSNQTTTQAAGDFNQYNYTR